MVPLFINNAGRIGEAKLDRKVHAHEKKPNDSENDNNKCQNFSEHGCSIYEARIIDNKQNAAQRRSIFVKGKGVPTHAERIAT